MSQLEKSIINKILVAGSRAGAKLFRNNVGLGWVGKSYRVTENNLPLTLNAGDVVIFSARPLHAGLCEGSSDIIGYRPLRITNAHIGKTIAQFVACEVKTKNVRATKFQANFLDQVISDGGIGVLAHDESDLIEELLKK